MSDGPDDRPATRASDLAQDLRALLSKLKRRLREQAHIGELTPSQVSVLLRLEKDGPATASGLARAEGMRAQSVRPVIIALQEAGLVVGQPDSNDGRQTVLSLTETCLGWIREGRAARQDWLSRTIEARLSPQQQIDVAKAVELLKGLVED
jgi:DNA-binding MarR family transcriptional regulator